MAEDITVKIDGMDILVKNAKLKIGIGICTGKSIDTDFVKMLLTRIQEWSTRYVLKIMINSAIPLDLSRNNIVDMAKEEKCDYLFFIDSDVLIGENQLEKLISYNKDAITGVYHQRSFPYYALPRNRVSKSLYCPIEIDIKDENIDIVEIDGSGMGCFLIKMDIFDKIPYPWFEFKYHQKDEKWGQISEDLYFCEKLKDIGIKIYCDPKIECTHMGTFVDKGLIEIYGNYRKNTLEEMHRTAIELSEFTGMPISDIHDKWKVSTEIVSREYKEFLNNIISSPNGKTTKDFYKTNKNYIFDITNWHVTQRRSFDYKLINDIKSKYPSAKKILDYGSGCGQNAIDLASAGYNVCMADYDGYTSQFARFRANKRGLNIKFYDIDKPIDDKFDIILAFDVLEHVPDEEFEKTVYLLKCLKENGGKILTTVSFGTQDGLHPMHNEETPEKLKLIEELNE